jgi:hypothetical protein
VSRWRSWSWIEFGRCASAGTWRSRRSTRCDCRGGVVEQQACPGASCLLPGSGAGCQPRCDGRRRAWDAPAAGLIGSNGWARTSPVSCGSSWLTTASHSPKTRTDWSRGPTRSSPGSPSHPDLRLHRAPTPSRSPGPPPLTSPGQGPHRPNQHQETRRQQREVKTEGSQDTRRTNATSA